MRKWSDFYRKQRLPGISCRGIHLLFGFALVFSLSVSRVLAAKEVVQKARAEIEALIQEKRARSPSEKKLDSQLVYALRKSRHGIALPGAPSLKASVSTEADGRLLIDMDADITAGLVDVVEKQGGFVVNQFPQQHALRALVPLGALEKLSARKEVRSLRPADRMANHGTPSDGAISHKAVEAVDSFGADGTGVKIGVLSDSVDHLAVLQSAGALPSVTILPGQGGTGFGEGTAMLEIVHGIAPGAKLYFATGIGSLAGFAQNIRNLQAAGCQVIVDDIIYFNESPFQDGPIAQAVKQVSDAGVLYFSAVGNSGSASRNTSSTWEGDFKAGGAATFNRGGQLHDFGGATANTVLPGLYFGRADLFWADPLGGSTNDYDLFVLDSAGSVVSSSANIQNGNADPYESINTVAPGERLVVVKYSGESRYLHLSAGRAYLEHFTPGAARGHNASGAANAVSVGAARVSSPPVPFTAASRSEPFSSDGPRRMFFNADGSAITPGDYSSTGGLVLQKPDLIAADGVTTSVPSFANFLGTSAAAPHAAAIAGLLWSLRPQLSPAEIRHILSATAIDIEEPGPDHQSGAGILMAYEALAFDLPKLVIQKVELQDADSDGTLDPDECANLLVTLKNLPASERLTATGVTAVLSSPTKGIRVDPSPRAYADLVPDGSSSDTASFTISATSLYKCGDGLDFVLHVSTSNGTSFTLPVEVGSAASGIGSPSVFTATDTPLPIPDPGSVLSSVNVQGFNFPIGDVRVGTYLTHPYVSDLSLSLQAPDGTEIILSLNNGVSGGDYGLSCQYPTIFSDRATTNVVAGSPPFGGIFAPQQPLTSLLGKGGAAVNGVWNLRVQDDSSPDSGTIQCWWLELSPRVCSPGSGPCLVPPSFVQAPVDQVATNGYGARFEVVAAGTEPIRYQWYYQGSEALASGTNAVLDLSGVSLVSQGVYGVVVSNPYGSVSNWANLSVVVRPTIACAGERTVELGQSWEFEVPTATGTNVVVTPETTVTNFGCGESYSVERGWVATDAGGFTARCSQLVRVMDRVGPIMTCAPQQVVAYGQAWDFGMPQVWDEGVAGETVYSWLGGLNVGSAAVGEVEVGDEIQLGGVGRYPVGFGLEWWAIKGGGLWAQVRFYLNDGVVGTSGRAEPGTVIYDSGQRAVGSGAGGKFTVENFGSGAVVPLVGALPETFTWTVRFGGLGQGGVAGLTRYGSGIGGQVGANSWQRTSQGWAWQNAGPGHYGAELVAASRVADISVVNTVTNSGCGQGYEAERTWESVDACGNKSQCSQRVVVEDRGLPVLVSQPQPQEVMEGAGASFGVQVLACPPVGYQWYWNQTNVVEGATNAVLELSEVIAEQAGVYRVRVSNGYGSVDSAGAELGVLVPARIIIEPDDQVAVLGRDAQFNVEAKGTEPIFYWWYFNETNLLADATNKVLELSAVTLAQSGRYSVVVSNAYRTTGTSAELTVVTPAAILSDLTSLIVTNGNPVSFSIGASGTEPFSYQWYFNGSKLLSSSSSATLNLPSVSVQDEGTYQVIVSNPYGTATSVLAHLTVLVPAAIQAPPTNLVVFEGATAEFSVAAVGTAPLTYQWFFNGVTPIEGATNAWLALTNATSAQDGNYSVRVANPYATVSATASLFVALPVVITSDPADQIATNGMTVSFEVTATGSAPLSYQWYFNDIHLLNDATNSMLALSKVTVAAVGSYFAVVSNPYSSATSAVAHLSVNAPAEILVNPVDQIATNGQDVVLSVEVQGTAPIWFQWFFNETNLLEGAIGPTLQLTSVDALDEGLYMVFVSNAFSALTSAPARLQVVFPAEILQGPTSQVVTNGNSAHIEVLASGTEPLSYQWFFNETNLLSGANQTSFNLANAGPEHAGVYSVVVSNPYATITSAPAHLIVAVLPVLTTSLDDQVATNGDGVSFEVVAVGTEPMSYQWYFQETNTLAFETNSVLALSGVSLASQGVYAVVVSNPYGSASNWANLSVVVRPTIACAGERTVELGESWDFEVPTATGTNVVVTPETTVTNSGCGESYTVERVWVATDEGGFTVRCSQVVRVMDRVGPVMTCAPQQVVAYGQAWDFEAPRAWETGAGGEVRELTTSVVNTVTNLGCGQGYEAERTWEAVDACGNKTQCSQRVVVEDRGLSVLVSQSSRLEVLEGAEVSFAANVLGCPPFVYQWYWNQTNAVEGATSAELMISAVKEEQAGDYRVRVSNAYGSVESAGTELVVRVPAQIVARPVDQVLEQGQNVQFSVVARGTEPMFYWWYFNGTNLLVGATNAVLELPDVTLAQSGHYSVVVSNAWGNATETAALNVLGFPSFVLQPVSISIPLGGIATFNAQATGNPQPTYQWFFQETNALAGATSPSLVITDTSLAREGAYTVMASNHIGASVSSPAILSLSLLPYIASQPQTVGVLKGGTAQFSVLAWGSPPFTYQWYFQGTNAISGATSRLLTVQNADFPVGGDYSVQVSNQYGVTNSQAAALRVLVQPQFLSVTRSGSVATISFTTISNLRYSVYYSANADTSSSWTILPKASRRLGTGLPMTIEDSLATDQQRFYRILVE